MRNLQIAFVVPSFPTVTETFVVNQICDMIDRGHNISIFAFHENEQQVNHEKISQYNLLERTTFLKQSKISKRKRLKAFGKYVLINHEHINFKKLLNILNVLKYGKAALNLQNYTRFQWLLVDKGFDIIHAHFGQSGAYIAEMKSFGFFAKTPLVTSFHGYDIRPHMLSDLFSTYRNLFEETALLTVNSPYTLSLLQELQPTTRNRVLPVGLDTKNFRNKISTCSTVFSILFIGRLVEFKAPGLALEIIQILISRGYQEVILTIVGEGELKDEIKKNIIAKKLEKNVVLKGSCTQEEVLRLMSSSDIFLLPGIHDKYGRAENQGLVIQEAQAMELPVVVSDAGGMKYGLLDGESGFVVKEGDIDGFADKIELLINNPSLRKKMGRKGREFVVENFDSKVLGDKLEAFYEELINR